MINRTGLFKFLALMILAVWAWKASANGFALPDQDAFATGRGEAFVATADNPSAIYYNPAGITQLEGNNVRGGLYGIYLDSKFSPLKGAPNFGHNYYNQDNLAAVPRIFYTYTPTTTNMLIPVSFGLGIYAPFGGNMSWPQDTGFRADALDGSLTYLTINPVVAVKLPYNFSIGAGLMVNYAHMELEQGITRFYLPPNTNFFRFTGDGWSVGYNLGVLWQPIDQISIGASFRSSAKVTLDGQARYEDWPQIYEPAQHSAQTDFKFPLTAVVGISYRPTPKWNMEFDASYTDWSCFGSNIIHQTTTTYPVLQDIPLRLFWQPSWMYEFGITRYFDSGWQASAGFVYNQNSVPNEYYTPLAADMDRYFFSAGTGYKGKHFNFDIAYQFGYGPTQTVVGSKPTSTVTQNTTNQNGDGKYDFISHAVSVSVGWRF
jgi:long-chain fatty acid transport protein